MALFVTRAVHGILVLGALPWCVGVIAYAAALQLLYGESIWQPDGEAVLYWSAALFIVAVPIAYLPAMVVVRALVDNVGSVALYAVVGGIVGLVPTTLLTLIFDSGRGRVFSPFFTPETILFSVLFSAAGVTFGMGYARWQRPSSRS